jgi:hypothetical protein
VIANDEISFSDTIVLTVPQDNDALVIDTDDGIIHGYHTN